MRGLTTVLLVAALAGCASGTPDPPRASDPPRQSGTPTQSAQPTTGPPVPPESAALRKRLVDSLATTNPPRARLVQTGKLTVVPAKWLSGWQIVDVVNSTLAHPHRFYLALSADGSVINLTAKPDDFNRVVTVAQPRVDSAKVAAEVATTFVDSTRSFVKASYRIKRVDDIDWLPKLDAEQNRTRRGVEASYGPQVKEPVARAAGSGWRISVWVVYDHQLIRHDLQVAGNGLVTDTPKTVVEGLPTPESL